ncbi:hypothetical protein A9P82_03225 [Arachidicoccus ginsenosidimutans]|uniref:DUF3822 family protein n=1 Tax=Arachidicoccus sp. BS20 TaxID=1850526 RepID=UPI0007F1287C|nr:DUF3822 family protein [Arachidicoccus sp. BS20]ANI88398.1 hypothetical protein A9P82_03225 [Arachidicoccus sp. BS20]
MLQKTFDVHQGKIPDGFLHLEVGAAHVALTAFDENKIASHNFEFYSFDANDDFENVLSQIYAQSSFLKHDYQQVKIVWENARAQYIPVSFYNDSMKDLVYPFVENSLVQQKRLLQKNDVFAVPFSVDEERWNLLHKTFPQAKDAHKYYEIIEQSFASPNDNKLHLLVIFYPEHFIIKANKNGKLQFINAVNFSSGTDVVYYLLNATKQLVTSISDTLATLSGLIDGDSTLFQEIYKYIPHIDVDSAENAAFLKENFGEYPSHFFVPFFKYA